MKKYLSLLIAILFTLSLNAGGGKAKIVFDSTVMISVIFRKIKER